jgi:16S rRNA (guanine966-N2)-methyltransferase
MRVIAGRYRGRRLRGPRGLELRPTSDRLKETLFNILNPVIGGAAFLDAFAGTGAIGIEAISRGAREVVFVEANEESCRLIRQNLDHCDITTGFSLLHQEVFRSLRRFGQSETRFDIVFMDPPYHWHSYADLLDTLYRCDVLHGDHRVVIEHHRKADLPDQCRGSRRTRTVVQGDKCLSFYQPVGTD